MIAERYGYEEAATPIFEFSDVFARTLGETSDIVTKEMYTFTDKGGDSITLRPEDCRYCAGADFRRVEPESAAEVFLCRSDVSL